MSDPSADPLAAAITRFAGAVAAGHFERAERWARVVFTLAAGRAPA